VSIIQVAERQTRVLPRLVNYAGALYRWGQRHRWAKLNRSEINPVKDVAGLAFAGMPATPKGGNMGLLDTILSAGEGGIVNQLASQFGVSGDQATSALKTMIPALAGGIQEKLSSGGSSTLSNLLCGGSLTRFADDPASATSPAGIEQGKSLLGSIFGSQDLSGLTSSIAEKTGLGGNIIGKMLPAVTTLLGGFLSKEAGGGTDKLTTCLTALTSEHQGILGAVKSMFAKLTG
jgi:hypothetical protein